MAVKESAQQALLRWDSLGVLQRHYVSFVDFLEDAMDFLGFSTTEIQRDIAAYLQYGPMNLMIQAQRGQAKSTITACFAVWSLIHSPTLRVLVLSAGGTQASEVSTLIVRMILNMPELECLRPDRNNGDRTSVEAFDVHYTLKGVDKSPSVACVGVTGNLQGKRANLLIADDIESTKNAMTAVQREHLLHLTKDFSSLVDTGRIVYLGTPQSMESIYNSLPSRGFQVRIWTGRYPTPKQRENYGDMLAPYITTRLDQDPSLGTGGGLLGDQGKPIDPELLDEDKLQRKELDQGPSYFQLQHMLNTKLMDALRFPLKLVDMIVMRITGSEWFPMTIKRGFGGANVVQFSIDAFRFGMQRPHEVSQETGKLQGKVMYVDPAGGGRNADETAYAIVGFLNGNCFLHAWGGVPGGYAISGLEELAKLAKLHKVTTVIIEKNMGFGSFREIWTPVLKKHHDCRIEDDLVGPKQKELRIIDVLEPVIARGSLIVNEDGIAAEQQSLQQYGFDKRMTYGLMFQLAKITRDRGALVHDDRADALAGAVAYWIPYMVLDQDKRLAAQQAAAHAERIKDPLRHNRCTSRPGILPNQTMFTKRTRRK